jgi:hypothetical protein
VVDAPTMSSSTVSSTLPGVSPTSTISTCIREETPGNGARNRPGVNRTSTRARPRLARQSLPLGSFFE